MSEIFMSFIHEEEWATKFVELFIRQVLGVDVFRSSSDTAIYAGDDWMNRVFEELKTAKVLVSMLSPISIQRPWINFEAGAAWMRDTKVIPVCFDGLKIGKLPKPYSSLQALEIGSIESDHYLVSSIAHHLKISCPPKPRSQVELKLAGGTESKEDESRRRQYEMLNNQLKAYSLVNTLTSTEASSK